MKGCMRIREGGFWSKRCEGWNKITRTAARNIVSGKAKSSSLGDNSRRDRCLSITSDKLLLKTEGRPDLGDSHTPKTSSSVINTVRKKCTTHGIFPMR